MSDASAARILAIGRSAGRLSFATADAKGRPLSSGAFPAEAQSVDIAVVGDYGLLGRPEVHSASGSGRLGLLSPQQLAHHGGGDSLAPNEVLRLWFDSPVERLAVPPSHLSRVSRFLGARANYTARMHETLDHASRVLSALLPDYFAALSERGRLLPEALEVLRAYPTLLHLQSASTLQLTHSLETALPGTAGASALRDRVFELHQRQTTPDIDPFDREFAASALPGWARDYAHFGERRIAIDREIHRLLSLTSAPRTSPAPQRDFSVLAIALSGERTIALETDAEALLARVESLLAERTRHIRHAQSAYEEYKLVRTALEQPEHDLALPARIRLDTVGQLLALSSGHYLDAVRYRRSCADGFGANVDSSATGGGIPDRLRADAAIAMALTEVTTTDMLAGFAALRGSIEGSLAAAATPELLTEAFGMFVLILVFFGENNNYPEATETCRSLIEAHGASGPARAPFDIAELFVAGGMPMLPTEEFERFRSTADANSRDTSYRGYFHYVVMLSAYVSRDFETGLAHYAEIKLEALLPRFNRRFARLSRLSYALNLAAKGEFALAHRELGEIEHSTDRVTDGADELILALAKLRLELAAGEHRNALTRTMPDGPLGEEQIIGVHLRRYAPVTLCIRGAALAREGASDLAAECFLRATQHSIMSGEWLGLLCVEGPEYRDWLAGLDRARLPQGVTEELLDTLLARPLFISLTLPSLTPQQRRVLRMLAQGRSTNSIASELHVSPNTLKSHLRALYQRLGVRSREQAVLRAESYGMLR